MSGSDYDRGRTNSDILQRLVRVEESTREIPGVRTRLHELAQNVHELVGAAEEAADARKEIASKVDQLSLAIQQLSIALTQTSTTMSAHVTQCISDKEHARVREETLFDRLREVDRRIYLAIGGGMVLAAAGSVIIQLTIKHFA